MVADQKTLFWKAQTNNLFCHFVLGLALLALVYE